MWIEIVHVTVSLGLLYFGGELLVRGAAALASRLNVSATAVGLTVVAFGTSAPELVVSLDAALAGADEIAVGNVVGSNIANITLILGLAVLLRPAVIQARIVRIDAPLLLFVSLGLAGVLANGLVSRREGVLLIVGLLAYTAFTFWEARREPEPVREELASAVPAAPASWLLNAAFVVAGLALLAGGGHLLVRAAVALAELGGISQATIGLTVVAVGTSLPELATTVVASYRGQGDIAIGNVVGSNLFNVLGILGATAVVHPLAMGAITWIDIGAMVGMAAVLTLLVSTRLRLGRPEGALLVASFVAYTSWLLLRG